MLDDREKARADALLDAQKRALALFDDIQGLGLIRPGVSESQLSKEIFRLSRDKYDAGRHWHKRIVRAGANTIHPYQEEPADLIVAEDDIVFIDLGPVFGDWEADFGRTFVLGDDPRKHRLRDDIEAAFHAGKQHFNANPDITGSELFDFVRGLAAARQWKFGNGHAGHIVGEFPHERIHGDRITLYIHPENHEKLRQLDRFGHRRHWILEIHFVDMSGLYGGFYEELLTV